MLNVARLALPRSPRRRRTGSGSGLLLILFVAAGPAVAQAPAGTCEPSVARVVAIQGSVEVQRGGRGNWLPVKRLEAPVCGGDRLRTGSLSRAALFLEPETLVRVDRNTTITVSVTTAEVLVEFFADNVDQAARDAHSCGAGYFITRFPRKFRVSGPHLNAAVEGTEFQVAVQCDATELAVLEGAVRAETVPAAGEERTLTAGQSLTAGAAAPAVLSTLIKPTDAVQWVIYYPPLSDAKAEADVPSREQCRALTPPSDQPCLTQRAEALLRLGQIDDALRDIDDVLRLNPTSGDANALRAIIQIAKNDKAAALQSAGAATSSSPNTMRPWLALSYVEQASFDLDKALESARKAQALEPNSSLVNARVAELLMSLGQLEEAELAARAAVGANPGESRAHAMLGFVHLVKIDTKQARADFETAIERDSFNPLPRLGLGLATIRDGNLVEGREQLEIAVALDPSNSLLRSYAGKAYYEENTAQRDPLAATQFELAGELDPRDPTPYFYNAILSHSENRPVEALHSLSEAASRNDDRAVYRSRLLLDDDAASRGATLAAVFGDLGFERLQINESSRALADNPGNASAHRELAAAYANVPRHDIARVSEALQAQIRQPVSIAPVPPMLGTDSLLVLKDVGPSQLGAQEFNQLFNRNDVEVTAEGLIGGRNSLGGQLVVTGLEDRVAYSLSALDYETDGFVENDAAEKAVYDLFVQGQLQAGSTMQADLKRSEIDVGQTFLAFHPEFAEPTTIEERGDALRLSGHHDTVPRMDLIWTAVYEDRTRQIFSFPDHSFLTGNDSETVAAELQSVWRVGQWQLVSGVGYVDQEDDYVEQISVSTTTANVYAYGQWRGPGRDLSVQVGASFDSFELENSMFAARIDKDRVNPRLGIIWSPMDGTTVRAALASTLKRPFVRGQTIEPTQVAGFNQYFTGFERFFGDPDGTESERIAVALDQVISESLKGGLELSKRQLEVAQLEGDFDWDEKSALAYIYKTFSAGAWQGAISLDGEYEKIERAPEFTGAEGILDLETVRAPLAASFFHGGLDLRVAATFVRQKGRFAAFPGDAIFSKDDQGLIVDVSAEYLLPRRKGGIAVGINNVFDEFVDLLEIDPLNPRVATRQLAFFRIRVEF